MPNEFTLLGHVAGPSTHVVDASVVVMNVKEAQMHITCALGGRVVDGLFR